MAYKNIEQRRQASKKHYLENKQKYLDRNRSYRASIIKFVQEQKELNPCKDCGIRYPYYVMDFDHLEKYDKMNDINFLSSTGRIGALKKEIAKCEIVCSNCHRIRTFKRLIMRTRSSAD